MDLAQCNERPGIISGHAELLQKQRAISTNGGVGVVLAESQIQSFSAKPQRSAAGARREPMYQPRELLE